MIDLKSKLLLIAVLFAVLTVSCEDKKYGQMLLERQKVQDSIDGTVEGKASRIPNDRFETIIFEGCEYLLYKEEPDNNSAFGFMAHKGNCSSPLHNPTSH